mmetsp:Transcript_21209/g.46205  ORF Transcript_21209/g.46205 Transcript_21209/m.46205 type:complete len:213 (+) Transcript_21209:356-994(+)
MHMLLYRERNPEQSVQAAAPAPEHSAQVEWHCAHVVPARKKPAAHSATQTPFCVSGVEASHVPSCLLHSQPRPWHVSGVNQPSPHTHLPSVSSQKPFLHTTPSHGEGASTCSFTCCSVPPSRRREGWATTSTVRRRPAGTSSSAARLRIRYSGSKNSSTDTSMPMESTMTGLVRMVRPREPPQSSKYILLFTPSKALSLHSEFRSGRASSLA